MVKFIYQLKKIMLIKNKHWIFQVTEKNILLYAIDIKHENCHIFVNLGKVLIILRFEHHPKSKKKKNFKNATLVNTKTFYS